jgi:hypothetical protein
MGETIDVPRRCIAAPERFRAGLDPRSTLRAGRRVTVTHRDQRRDALVSAVHHNGPNTWAEYVYLDTRPGAQARLARTWAHAWNIDRQSCWVLIGAAVFITVACAASTIARVAVGGDWYRLVAWPAAVAAVLVTVAAPPWFAHVAADRRRSVCVHS